MYIYICICMYIHICIYMYQYVYVCMYINVYIFKFVCIYLHIIRLFVTFEREREKERERAHVRQREIESARARGRERESAHARERARGAEHHYKSHLYKFSKTFIYTCIFLFENKMCVYHLMTVVSSATTKFSRNTFSKVSPLLNCARERRRWILKSQLYSHFM